MNSPALLLTSALLLLGSNTFAACAPQQILRDDVLIVVNDNSIASPQIGDYYCEQRGIDPANIAHVRVPATSDVLLDQFENSLIPPGAFRFPQGKFSNACSISCNAICSMVLAASHLIL